MTLDGSARTLPKPLREGTTMDSDVKKKEAAITKFRRKKLQEDPTLCKTCLRAQSTPGNASCQPCRDKQKLRYQTLKVEVFKAYGGAICACCGEKELKFLCIDHINNDRPEQCKEMGWKNPSADRLYSWLKRNKFPKGYQVLCWNCNRGKWANGGICPHKKGEEIC